jgi:hypothetical protein
MRGTGTDMLTRDAEPNTFDAAPAATLLNSTPKVSNKQNVFIF